MPVYERTVGVLLPCPNVQRIKRRQSKTVRGVEQVKQLAHQFWRIPWMVLVPHIGEDEEVGSNELSASVWRRFVDHDLRTRRIQHALIHQLAIYIMK